jgi:hypothetical protein
MCVVLVVRCRTKQDTVCSVLLKMFSANKHEWDHAGSLSIANPCNIIFKRFEVHFLVDRIVHGRRENRNRRSYLCRRRVNRRWDGWMCVCATLLSSYLHRWWKRLHFRMLTKRDDWWHNTSFRSKTRPISRQIDMYERTMLTTNSFDIQLDSTRRMNCWQ